MEIKQVALDKVWALRQAVMYPTQLIEFVQLKNDKDGLHLGVFLEEELVSVISVFIKNGVLQFRKFATKKDYQGKGFGTQLLNAVFELAKEQSCHTIRCNARSNAVALYQKFGMQQVGELFAKNGFDYILMEYK